MRLSLAVLCALLVPAAEAAAPSVEAVKLAAEQKILAAPASAAALRLEPGTLGAPRTSGLAAEASRSDEGLMEAPQLSPLSAYPRTTAEVGRVNLANLLDRHRDLVNRQLGASKWDISVAGDAGFKNFFLTFQQRGKFIIRPLGDLNRLRDRDGVDIEIEPGLTYNFHATPKIWDLRGSTVELYPAGNTQGPEHEVTLGEVLDAVKARSYVFKANGVEYWALHGTDVDPATNALAQTRSFLFFNWAGMSSKAWPIAESALPLGQPTAVKFGNSRVILTRTAGGELVVSTN